MDHTLGIMNGSYCEIPTKGKRAAKDLARNAAVKPAEPKPKNNPP
jgi:hypothetical protein